MIDLIASWGPNNELDLSRLSRKLAILLALATLLRTAELSLISFDSVRFTEDGASFSLGRPRKSQHSGALQTIAIKKLGDPLVCPVHCLGTYRALTDVCRNKSNSERLLIGLISPFNNVSASTVSRWIKWVLKEAKVEAVFSAHSTRGAAASRAVAQGVPIDSVLRSVNWAAESTFTRFYRRAVPHSIALSEAVLSQTPSL